MAYDLLLRKRTTANWSRRPSLGFRGLFLLTEYEFAPDPTPATDEEKQFIAKLAVLKMSADAGNKKAAKEWKATLAKLDLVRKKAAQGDEKSKHLVVVLKESGIFDGVQAMSVTGDEAAEDKAAMQLITSARKQMVKEKVKSPYLPDRLPIEQQLAVLKDAASKGDPAAQAKWSKIEKALPRIKENDPIVFNRFARAGLVADNQSTSGAYTGVPMYPYQTATSNPDTGEMLIWPIVKLIEFFQSRSAKAADRTAATQAVNEAIAKGLTSGDKFRNALWLAFGFNTEGGYKYGNEGQGVPEVRTSVVKKVRAGDPKAIAFYKAALKAGYTPSKNDPGLAQMSGDDVPSELQERREARRILDDAAQAKSIARADLKRAIWLHAGSQSTEAERAAVGGKMLEFLSKRQVKLSS